ncbi:unnamed protein product [Phyllotreta striolata]|uniref:Uncharacterized protein n=1 Tax=Phyllotreta striolata TaxID=444603 RepID=A0A9N9TP77_PHYSR|nr:unnamed protein product [Phyllotreta striolata]
MDVDNLVTAVQNLYTSKKWKKILKLNKNSNEQSALKLLWVWPDESNLFFIKRTIVDFGCRGISSIGCGCGLLEWIINESTGVPVVGYEINKEWWESKYSNPKFIKLNYVEDNEVSLNPAYALLFCYFNDKHAFQQYVRNYKGDLVLIIGPGKGSLKHTEPEPFNADFGCTKSKWILYNSEEVKNTNDFIAVYVRDNSNYDCIN